MEPGTDHTPNIVKENPTVDIDTPKKLSAPLPSLSSPSSEEDSSSSVGSSSSSEQEVPVKIEKKPGKGQRVEKTTLLRSGYEWPKDQA